MDNLFIFRIEKFEEGEPLLVRASRPGRGGELFLRECRLYFTRLEVHDGLTGGSQLAPLNLPGALVVSDTGGTRVAVLSW